VYAGCAVIVVGAIVVRVVGEDARRVTDRHGHRRLLQPGGPR
jgi:hypothetical protein